MEITHRLLFVVVGVLGWTAPGEAYSSGSISNTACLPMLPGHGVPPQDTAWPFSITASTDSYELGQNITVTLEADEGQTFKGFMLQARPTDPGRQGELLGHFHEIPGLTRVRCTGAGITWEGDAMVHSSAVEKTSVSVTWTAPMYQAGDIQFLATTVEYKEKLWQAQKSDVVLTGPAEPTEPTEPTEGSPGTEETPGTATTTSPTSTTTEESPPVVDVDISGCGINKGCFREPPECKMEDCEFLVTWSVGKTHSKAVDIGLRAKVTAGQQYMALGLSKDRSMGDSSVMECIYDAESGKVINQASYNEPGHANTELDQPGLGFVPGTMRGSYSDGILLCRFSRYKTLNVTGEQQRIDAQKIFPLDADYHLLLAKGPTHGPHKLQHDKKMASAVKVNLVSGGFVDLGGRAGYPLLKAHGCMMIFAWVTFAGLGVLMPRHFKSAWSGHTWNGLLIWFQIHRACMIMVFLLTTIAFSLAFIEIGEFSHLMTYPDKAHPVLGIIVTVLTVINPLMSLLRPAPGAPRRPIFNWAHFCVGQSAHILAVCTVFIGLRLNKANVASEAGWVMVGFVVWHIIAEFLLFVIKNNVENRITDMDDLELKCPTEKETQKDAAQTKASSLKTLVLVVYACGNAATAGALVSLVASA